MESILALASREEVWEDFLAYRLCKERFDWKSFQEADKYVEERQYFLPLDQIARGDGLGIPDRTVINKMGTGKKRIVYHYGLQEMELLKLVAHLLYRYDGFFSPNCYAFRRGVRVCDAIRSLNRRIRGRQLWAYKVDIHNYFNSISIPKLLPILARVLEDDLALYHFFERLLDDDRAMAGTELVREQRGVMAGLPIASFLANVYLMEVDRHFEDAGVIYARYSDDIILFAPDEQTLLSYKATLLRFFDQYSLEVNPSKEFIYRPDEAFEFLGFRCKGKEVDISAGTREKLKGKIRRKAHALHRWASKNQKYPSLAVKALIRQLNRKLFDENEVDSLNWTRYFFPLINRTEGLREIDHYVQDQCRYLMTGKHNKANYRTRYAQLKALGYRSLVNEFYAYREMNAIK